VTRRLSDEAGFTLVELLVAMIVGLIVMFAALAVMDGSYRIQDRTADTIDATDRGRIAMDRITQQLDGRVCVPATTVAPILPAAGSIVTATDNQIEFYASITSDTAPRLVAERRRMTYRPATNDILLETWRATAAPPVRPPANTTTPTSTKVIASGVRPTTAGAPVPPIFAYYALQGTPPAPKLATLKLTPPLTTAQLDSVALVKTDFVAAGKRSSVGTEFQNDSLTRSPTSCS
jgi:prepilin-type N-terminal cleavage/methylation domain-containing protein